MIRSLRRRFVWGAMLSLCILLVILIGGMLLVGYVQMERRADELMDRIVENDGARTPPPAFASDFADGSAGHSPTGYYAVSVDESWKIRDVRSMGTWEREHSEMQPLVDDVRANGEGRGRMGRFKFAVLSADDGNRQIILLDNAPNARFLADTLRTGLVMGALCLAIMFLILQPVSRRLTVPFVQNMQKQRQFITNAGHDIKTPVAIIQSNIDAMELIQGENKWSRNIRAQTLRLTELLSQLLMMARMEENTAAHAERIELAGFLKNECEAYAEALRLRNLDLSLQIVQDIALQADRERLGRIVRILMDNAARYAGEGGNISVSAQKRGSRIRVCFENTVEQLPPCPPETLFDRFYRADPSRSQSGGGSGIGLSAARAIAESVRWKLDAQYIDETHIGFTVEIPT